LFKFSKNSDFFLFRFFKLSLSFFLSLSLFNAFKKKEKQEELAEGENSAECNYSSLA